MNDVNFGASARQAMSGPPSGYFLVVPQGQQEESVSLATVLVTVGKSWRLVVASVVGGGLLALLVSLFVPWARYARVGEAGPRLPTITLTGWQASTGAAWCLLLDAAAIVSVVVAARGRSRRATIGALPAAGWIAAAIAAVIPVRAIGVSELPFGIERSLTVHEPGFYLALGCAAMIMLLGLLLMASPSDPGRSA